MNTLWWVKSVHHSFDSPPLPHVALEHGEEWRGAHLIFPLTQLYYSTPGLCLPARRIMLPASLATLHVSHVNPLGRVLLFYCLHLMDCTKCWRGIRDDVACCFEQVFLNLPSTERQSFYVEVFTNQRRKWGWWQRVWGWDLNTIVYGQNSFIFNFIFNFQLNINFFYWTGPRKILNMKINEEVRRTTCQSLPWTT